MKILSLQFFRIRPGLKATKSGISLKNATRFFAMAVFVASSGLHAQSSDDSSSSVVKELEDNLESERTELENVLRERENMLAEQADVRDQLAEEQEQLKAKMEALLELCEQHNAVNADNTIDCDKEVNGS